MIDYPENEGYDWVDDEGEEIEDKCIVCKKVIFNYPPSWDPICPDCWNGYTFRNKKI